MTRIFLIAQSILFLGFGVYVFVQPNSIAEMLGAETLGPGGAYELHSNYGGVSLGIGLMTAFGALRAGLARPALFVLLAYTGGYALGRVLALPIDGVPPMNLVGFGIYEAVTAALSFLLLRSAANKTAEA